MTSAPLLGLLGGTFDPVHFGHLDAAEAACKALGLDEVLFVPAHDPPHRRTDPLVTPFHRFALLALAVADERKYRVSDIELIRPGPSYTSDTLRSLHAAGWHATQLFFILGTDAFAEIATWHHYPGILEAAHFVVIARPGMTIQTALARTPHLQPRACAPADAVTSGGTRIVMVEARTRDVSSTAIRQRLTARAPVDDLVPAAVARHIVAHHLYGAEDDLHGEYRRVLI